MIDYAFRRFGAIDSHEIMDELKIFERLRRQLVNGHFLYLRGLRRRRARASWALIPRPASNCCRPRSIFSRT